MAKEPHTRDRLSSQAIRALQWIIMTSLLGIIAINIVGTLIQADLLAGLFGSIEQDPEAAINTDEALSILGNLGSAAVGGLVGWLTRDYLESSDKKDREAEVAEAQAAAVAVAPIVEEGTTMTEYDPDLEDGPEEEFIEDVEDVEIDEAETEALMQDEPEPEPDEVEPDEVKP